MNKNDKITMPADDDDVIVIGVLEIVGYTSRDHLSKSKESIKRYNLHSDKYIYGIVENPRGIGYGYYLIREKRKSK